MNLSNTPVGQRPTLRQGDRGDSVRELQTILTNLGYSPGVIDGVFGTGTLNAVRAFQRDNNLAVDGVVGQNTWNLLLTPPVQNFTYTVVVGDTLFNIANRFNTTVDTLVRLNSLTSTVLRVGQQLLIPGTPPVQNITYTVVRGDTLFGIASRFNTTVDEIMRLNNLTSTALSIGQVLQIPQ